MITELLGWAAFAGSLLITGQAAISWHTMRRWQVITQCLIASLLFLLLALGGR